MNNANADASVPSAAPTGPGSGTGPSAAPTGPGNSPKASAASTGVGATQGVPISPALPADGTVVLKAEGLGKTFTAPVPVPAVRGVNLSIARGELVALVGPSGSGKSTLLAMLGGLLRPSAGEVTLCGTALAKASDDDLARVRNVSLGFVFQFHHLLAELTALENVALPGIIAAREGWITRDPAAVEARARDLLGAVGLGSREDHLPAQLSGGEAQRVTLARALMNGPALVLADEPTGNLDRVTAAGLMDLMERMNREQGQAFLVATHNAELEQRASRVLKLVGGEMAT